MITLTLNEEQSLQMFLNCGLKGGYAKQAKALLKGIDLTGGLVAIDDQVSALHTQFIINAQQIED